jgi:hypothetical protein
LSRPRPGAGHQRYLHHERRRLRGTHLTRMRRTTTPLPGLRMAPDRLPLRRKGNRYLFDHVDGVAATYQQRLQRVVAAWSPDGTRIAFQTDRDGNGEIYLMAPMGAGRST